MRMHSYGKCSSNLIVGALTIFSIIVLYNYWSVSTVNHDLTLKYHSLEKQIISLSKANEALHSNLEKIQEENKNLDKRVVEEQEVIETGKNAVGKKDQMIKSLKGDVENAKHESRSCRNDINEKVSKIEEMTEEATRLKEKIISLEAQLAEKKNSFKKLEGELKDTKRLMEKEKAKSLALLKQSTAKTAPLFDDLPVLNSDRAEEVSPPPGWMIPQEISKKLALETGKNVKLNLNAVEGSMQKGPQVIIFDDPSLPRQKARFSVLDPPKSDISVIQKSNILENQQNPNVVPAPLRQPNQADGGGIQNYVNGNGNGNKAVLQAPIHGQDHEENLDAAEDDGKQQLNVDFAADDQSPDGDLNLKNENKQGNGGILQNIQDNNRQGVLAAPQHSNQQDDERAQAHLRNNALDNNIHDNNL